MPDGFQGGGSGRQLLQVLVALHTTCLKQCAAVRQAQQVAGGWICALARQPCQRCFKAGRSGRQ